MRQHACLALAGVLALLAGACASARPPASTSTPAPAAVRLSDADIRSVATIVRLEDRREYDAPVLQTLARSPAAEVRRRAYLAAGRIGSPAGRALARAGLTDPAPTVRAAAAFALGLLRDSVAVDSLARMSLGDAPVVAEQAAFALGRIGTAAAHTAVAGLLDFAAHGGTSIHRDGSRETIIDFPSPALPGGVAAPVVGRALLTVWRFKRIPDDARVVRGFAASPDTALRWRAAYALMRLGDPATVPDLLRLLRDPYPGVRAQAARGLRASVVDSAGQRAPAQGALVAALNDGSPRVRIQAATALAGYRAPDLVAPLTRVLRDRDGNVAIAAARALGALRQPAAAAVLQALADSAGAPLPLRAAALDALCQVSLAAGVNATRRWATASSWRERYYGADALGFTRWTEAAAAVEAAVRDPDPRVAADALTSMQELLGDSIAPPRTVVIEALDAPDPIVRAAAINVLAARPDPANLQALLDSYARAAADTMDDAAVAAVDALGALEKAGAPAAHDFFARFRRSSDPIVRQHVATALGGDWGPVFPVETGRTPAFYEDLVRRLVAPALAGAPLPRATIRTITAAGPGEITLELAAADEPLTVDNFLGLARRRYFDGDRWHRVVPDFVVQDGDPRGDGNGGPGWAIRDELSATPYLRGTLGMALSGPDTGGSQFFVALSPQPHLDGGYTVFGHVVAGWDLLDHVLQDDLIESVTVQP